MNFEDPNDPRNYPIRNPLFPPINLNIQDDGGPLMYHDFDYVGYDHIRKRTPDLPKKKQTIRTAVESKPKLQSNNNYSRKNTNIQTNESSNSAKFNSIGLSGRLADHRTSGNHDNHLPDIIKKGPINKRD